MVRACWVLWRLENRDGRPTKVPYQADGRHRAKSNDPSTWSWFDTVVAVYRRGGWDGIGIMLGGGTIAGIDLDHCRYPESGELEAWARAIVDEQLRGTYIEVSPSGTGIRAFCIGTLPPGRRRSGHVEIYDSSDHRFLTVTGHRISDSDELAVIDLGALHAQLFPEPDPPRAAAVPVLAGNVSDDQVLELAFSASNGAEIQQLFAGDASSAPSPSEAVQKLLHRLVFYTRDIAQVDRLMRRSGLMREKWDERRGDSTWGIKEIEHALSRVTSSTHRPVRSDTAAVLLHRMAAAESRMRRQMRRHGGGRDGKTTGTRASKLSRSRSRCG